MKYLVSVLLGAYIAITVTNAKAVENCKCWVGYEASESASGPECVGILLLHSMACNIPQSPQCKCSGNVNGILKDQTGTWCSTYSAGKEVKRWECENKEEWNKFYAENPDYKP